VISPETRMMGLPYGEEIMIVGRTLWTQSTSVTDGQPDRQNYDNKYRATQCHVRLMQPRRSIVPETNNTRREDNKVGDAAAATEATCYDDDDDSKELKGSKVRETDNSEVENNKVHGGFDAEEKQEKEEDNDGDNDDDDDDDSDEDD